MARLNNAWLLTAGAVIVLAVLLLGGFSSSFGSFYNFQSGRVYEPAFGTLTCRETQNVPSTISSLTNHGGATGNLFYQNVLGPQITYPLTFASLASFQNFSPSPIANTSIAYQCNQSRCVFLNNDPSANVSCPSGGRFLYRMFVRGSLVANNQANVGSGGSLTFQNSNPLGNTTINQNDTVLIEGTCVSQPTDLFAAIRTANPSSASIPVQVYIKQFEVNVPGGVPVYQPSTDGCSWNDIYDSTRGHELGPQNNSLLDQILNPLTGQSSVSASDRSRIIPQRTGITRSDSIEPYGVNEQRTFVAGWREVSGASVLTLDNGDRVVVNVSLNKVYRVNSVQLSNGQTVQLANQVYRDAPQCTSDIQCSSTLGATYRCRTSGPNANEYFTCFNASQGGNQCTVATQVVDCGASTYRTTGSQTEYVSNVCVSGTCQVQTTVVACNPFVSGAQNGCPSSAPVCVQGSGGQTSCVAQAIPSKTACPSDCCRDDPNSPYFSKACSGDLVCQDSGGFSGQCVAPPSTPSCGDGICQSSENANSCVADCGLIEPPLTCQEGFHLVIKNTPQYLIGNFIQTGTVTETSCQPDLPIGFVVVALAVLGAGALFYLGNQKKRGRR